MKRESLFAILTVVLMSVVFVCSIQSVSAENKIVEYLPLSCERTKGNYKPMTTLVVVPLTDDLVVQPGATAQQIATSLYFDLAYVRGNNVAPLNAVAANGEIAFLSCPYPDYLANIVTASDTGYFVLGVYGNMPVTKVQELIDSYKMTVLLRGDLVLVADEKNTTIALANTEKCDTICKGITQSKEGVTKRALNLSLQEPEYSKSVRQKELVSFIIKIKNEGEFPIYPSGQEALALAPLSKGVSQLYHSSWIAPNLIARLPGMLLPGEESAISVTLGAPLLPGKYSESLVLKSGNSQVGKPMALNFVVENDNYKLGRIISKDGSAFANLRGTPSLKGSIVGRIDVGTYVIVKGYQDAWVKIETKEGRVGWVYKPFIR